MAKDPAFLFYSQDFYMGTMDMTAAQVGCYIRLLCLQHSKGHLSEALMTATMGGKWDEDVAGKFLVDENRHYYNGRLDEEISKRGTYTESRRRNLSASPTHMQKHMAQHMPQHMENENEDVNVNGIEDGNGDGNGNPLSIPPTLKAVRSYCVKRGNSVDPEKFMDYYETRGWMVGKVKMKNWQSAVHTGERNGYSNTTKSESPMNWAQDMMERENK